VTCNINRFANEHLPLEDLDGESIVGEEGVRSLMEECIQQQQRQDNSQMQYLTTQFKAAEHCAFVQPPHFISLRLISGDGFGDSGNGTFRNWHWRGRDCYPTHDDR
jgi:hypothetical protein